jgi:hypothetical protein
MRRLTVIAIALSLTAFTACYTALKQTRAPVSADCSTWPAPSDQGSRLVLRLGQVGTFGDLKILFADLDLNAGPRFIPYDYGYPGPFYPGGWYQGAGWYGRRPWPAADYLGGWYGPRRIGPTVDAAYIAVCTPEGVPTDRRFYLSHSPYLTNNTVDVGPYTISVERLRVEPPETPPDSLDTRDENGRVRARYEAILTLTVSRES